MTTITLELPDALIDLIRRHEVDEATVKAVAIAALELWLAQAGEAPVDEPSSGRRFSQSAVPFARRLVAQNRKLFAALAKR
jgi:hypothetical protein